MESLFDVSKIHVAELRDEVRLFVLRNFISNLFMISYDGVNLIIFSATLSHWSRDFWNYISFRFPYLSVFSIEVGVSNSCVRDLVSPQGLVTPLNLKTGDCEGQREGSFYAMSPFINVSVYDFAYMAQWLFIVPSTLIWSVTDFWVNQIIEKLVKCTEAKSPARPFCLVSWSYSQQRKTSLFNFSHGQRSKADNLSGLDHVPEGKFL